MYTFTGQLDTSSSFLEAFFSRLIAVPTQTNAYYFQVIPEQVPFQITVNKLTALLEPILKLLGISLSRNSLEASVSYNSSGQYYSLVASGFVMSYGIWNILSPLSTLIFSLLIIKIDNLLHLFKSNTGFYSVYCYLISTMPVIVGVSYTYAVGNFGMCFVPLFWILLQCIQSTKDAFASKLKFS